MGAAFVQTLAIGLITTGLALLLAALCLENETRQRQAFGRAYLGVVYFPLIVPQGSFVFGIQILAVALGLESLLATVIVAHLVFVFPYVLLSLSQPWRALDLRFAASAAALGAAPWRVFLSVRLPLLLRPILTAAAVGFVVSVGQYLPTVMVSGGRVETVTTQSIALASGGNRRLVGAYALLQTLLPLAAFALAGGVPRWLARHRRGWRAP